KRTRGAKEAGFEKSYQFFAESETHGESQAESGANDSWHGPGRQHQPVLPPTQRRPGAARSQGGNHAKGDEGGVRTPGARPHRHRGRDALTLGKPAAPAVGPRSDCGQSAAGEADQRKQPQERPGGRADVGAAGARRPAVVASDSSSRGEGANGSDEDSGARSVGGHANSVGELHARVGQIGGGAAAQL